MSSEHGGGSGERDPRAELDEVTAALETADRQRDWLEARRQDLRDRAEVLMEEVSGVDRATRARIAGDFRPQEIPGTGRTLGGEPDADEEVGAASVSADDEQVSRAPTRTAGGREPQELPAGEDPAIEAYVPTCPRCGRDHANLPFAPFQDPSSSNADHWGLCPYTGEPILLSIADLPETSEEGSP